MNVSDKYLLSLFRQIVGQRANWRCEKCLACGKYFHPHHVYSRDNKSVRYDPINGVWLCPDCHRYAHAVGEGHFISELVEFGLRPADWPDELNKRKNQIVTISPALFRQDQKIILLQELKKAA